MITDQETTTVNESAAAQADDSAATYNKPDEGITTTKGVDNYDPTKAADHETTKDLTPQRDAIITDAKPAIDKLWFEQQEALKSAEREKSIVKATGIRPVPSLGRIVLYTMHSGADTYPAVIVRVFHDELVALKVFTDQETDFVVDQALLGDTPGTWAWPPRT